MNMSQIRRSSRLVNLHSLILDHERTLSGLIQKTDKHFEHDIISPLVSSSTFNQPTLNLEPEIAATRDIRVSASHRSPECRFKDTR